MSKAIRQQILRAEREQARAFSRGDVRGALRMFDPSFVGFSSTRHKRIRGLRTRADVPLLPQARAQDDLPHCAATRAHQRRHCRGNLLPKSVAH